MKLCYGLGAELVIAVGHHGGLYPSACKVPFFTFTSCFLNLDVSSGPFIPSFNTHFPNAHHMPGILLGAGGLAMSESPSLGSSTQVMSSLGGG